jgi:hypothetical protein
MNKRSAIRAEAKRLYKEQVKGVPKRQRLSFAEFFKKYRDMKTGKINDVEMPENAEENEDFDFDNIINVNKISDDDLEKSETPQTIIKDEEQV